MKKLAVALLMAVCLVKAAHAADNDKRTYIFAAGVLGHPYWNAAYAGFDYAARKFGVEIKKAGPQDWNPPAQAEAVEQSIAKHPDGIVAVLWDGLSIPPIKKAMAAGIPVVVIEANLPDSGAMSFIGLDNYQAGADTAKELIKLGGETGNVVAMGNGVPRTLTQSSKDSPTTSLPTRSGKSWGKWTTRAPQTQPLRRQNRC